MIKAMMDAVFNNPVDWEQREQDEVRAINGVKVNRERGLKAAETTKVNKQMALDCGLPKMGEFDVVPFDLEAFPTPVIADRFDNNVQPYVKECSVQCRLLVVCLLISFAVRKWKLKHWKRFLTQLSSTVASVSSKYKVVVL